MPEVVEAETMAIWNLDHLLGRRSEMIFHKHIRHARCFSLAPGGGEDGAVGKYLFPRPLRESFYDFQLNQLLWLLGMDWFDAEMAKPLPERHVILRWRDGRN